MLVLLIIFMVTAPIIQQGVEVSIPKVKAAALKSNEEEFVVPSRATARPISMTPSSSPPS